MRKLFTKNKIPKENKEMDGKRKCNRKENGRICEVGGRGKVVEVGSEGWWK